MYMWKTLEDVAFYKYHTCTVYVHTVEGVVFVKTTPNSHAEDPGRYGSSTG